MKKAFSLKPFKTMGQASWFCCRSSWLSAGTVPTGQGKGVVKNHPLNFQGFDHQSPATSSCKLQTVDISCWGLTEDAPADPHVNISMEEEMQ